MGTPRHPSKESKQHCTALYGSSIMRWNTTENDVGGCCGSGGGHGDSDGVCSIGEGPGTDAARVPRPSTTPFSEATTFCGSDSFSQSVLPQSTSMLWWHSILGREGEGISISMRVSRWHGCSFRCTQSVAHSCHIRVPDSCCLPFVITATNHCI